MAENFKALRSHTPKTQRKYSRIFIRRMLNVDKNKKRRKYKQNVKEGKF